MDKDMKILLSLEAKGRDKVFKDIDNTQKNIDNLRKKAIELTQALKEKTVAKHDTSEIEKNLKEVNKQLGEEKKLMGLLREEANKLIETEKTLQEEGKKASNALDSFAHIQNLQTIAASFSVISDSLSGVGNSLIDAAAKSETLKTAMYTAFQGAKDQADAMMSWAKNFANVTPFETNEVVEATIKLKAYGVSASEIPAKLQQIGDMASGMGKGLNQAVEAYADAQTGELERLKEFGITKAMIDKQMGGTLLNAQGQVKDLSKLMEGLSQIMEQRFAGGMQKQSETFSGAVSNMRGEIQTLKETFGNLLLPTVKDVTIELTKFIKYVQDMPPELQKTVIAFGGMGTGLALIATGISGAISVLAPLGVVVNTLGTSIAGASALTLQSIPSIVGMRTALLSYITTARTAIVTNATLGAGWVAALPIIAVGAMVIALGGLVYATQEYEKSVIQLQKTDMETSLKKQANALNALKDVYPEATTSAIGFQKVIEEGIENILKQADGLFKYFLFPL
ncbi:MAG TPA: hypothetical protein PKJ95_03405, partial [Atribacterota bacterium]|nr:hypothetical protein [Atribacterota bacterium]